MLRCKSCLKRMETNKAESKDATQDEVDDFNEDTCNVYAYDESALSDILTHNHSHDNMQHK